MIKIDNEKPSAQRISKPPLLENEGDRIRIPEGGELVCCRSFNETNRLYLKVEYSRQMLLTLESSPLSHMRPTNFSEIVKFCPEVVSHSSKLSLLTISKDQIYTDNNDSESSASSSSAISSIAPALIEPTKNLKSPKRGPIQPVDDVLAAIHYRHIMEPKKNNLIPDGVPLSPAGFPMFPIVSPIGYVGRSTSARRLNRLQIS